MATFLIVDSDVDIEPLSNERLALLQIDFLLSGPKEVGNLIEEFYLY